MNTSNSSGGFRASLAATALLSLAGAAQAGTPTMLPSPTSQFCVEFGDFTSCSLPIAGITVQSTPGQISDDIVIFTGSNGMPVTTNIAGVDNAYDTPNGSSPLYFDTADGVEYPEPSNGPAVGDQTTTWDADISVLRTFLDGKDLVVFFNLNDTNSENGLEGQDQLAWAEIMLRDLDGGAPDQTFYLSSSDDPFGIPTATDELATGLADSIANGAPEAVPANDPVGTGDFNDANTDGCKGVVFGSLVAGCTDTNGDLIDDDMDGIDSRWGYVHGQICVDSNGDIFHLGECNAFDPAGVSTVNQNLGANEAAFAIFNEDLSDLINDPTSGYDVLSARILLSRIDNGFEQAFIRAVMFPDDNGVPEPLTLSLLGIGFIGAGFARRRRAAR